MFLTDAELVALTGRTKPTAQVRWLRGNGWPIVTDARGRPRVLQSVVIARLGGVQDHRTSGPNWDALNGTP